MTNHLRTSTTGRPTGLAILLAVGLTLLTAGIVGGYVLSGGQVLAQMEAKRSVPQSLEVRQVVSRMPLDGAPRRAAELQETLNYRYPDHFRADSRGDDFQRTSIRTPQDRLVVVNGQIQSGPPERFETYQAILLNTSRAAMSEFLLGLGVDLDLTSLGRFEDAYCYIIGADYPDESASQLWIEKDTFRPLRLMLPPPVLTPEEGALEIRFLDWGQIEGTAYPMRIQVYRQHQLVREVRVANLRVDPLQDPALFDTAGLRATLPQWGAAPILTPPPASPGDSGTIAPAGR
ncbi:MAG: hypothetical protein QNJ04_07930 [Desulfobacterales bacterium]|nr:hypothetical protein [Desulfobacterales bacterium]